MPTYEYLAAELVGAQQMLTTLPLVGVRFGSLLNGAGPISATLKLTPLPPAGHATAGLVREQNRLYKDATGPARRALYVLRDGVVMGAYVWWSRAYDPETQTISLSGAELWSLLRRRRITWQAAYSLQDQLAIARDIITRSMAVAGGNLALTLGGQSSPRTRDRNYFDYEAKPVAEAVEELAQVIDGFDFALTAALSGGTISRTVEFGYPRRGRTAAQSGHVFAWGRNITKLAWVEEASSMANSIIGLGKGEGLSKVRTRVTDTTAFAEGYPLLEDSISLGDIEVLDTLDGHVRAELAQRARPRTLPQVTVRADSDPPLGSYITGDDCHLVIPSDVDPYWPDGITEPGRIHAIDVTPTDGSGVETVTLTLGRATAGA